MIDDDDFHPDDIEEMSATFEKIIRETDEGGFVMEFTITMADAESLVMNWFAAFLLDNEEAQQKCLTEYGKIMYHLNAAIRNSNPDWDMEMRMKDDDGF